MKAVLAGVALLVLLANCSGASGSRGLLGSEKCTWGPSYWCSGLQQSSKCEATSHCIDRVWNSNPYPADDDEVCTICKNMVKEARDTLLSNETQEELKEVFEGSCDLIPIKIIRNECKKMADEFVPELVETLSSEMNPDTVCTVAGLCNSVRIDKMLAKFKSQERKVHQTNDCDICKVQAKKLSTQIHNADKDLVLDKLLEFCGQAGSYSDACRAMVMESFDEIYDVLIHLDEGLCDLSGMCPASSNAVSTFSANAVVGGDIQCEFCEKVIQHWIDTWTSDTTQEEFKDVLEALCHKFPAKRVNHCLHIVDDYYIPWFNYVLHWLDPKTVCKGMGLCPPIGENQDEESGPISLLLTPPELTEEEDQHPQEGGIRLIGGYFAPQTFVILEKPGCAICEYVINDLQTIIGSNRSEAQIEAGLEKVCSVLPSVVRDQCDNLVETYGPAIVEILSRDIDAKDVCTLMQLCDSKAEELLSQMPEDNPIVEMKVKDGNCALCQYAMNTLYQLLENKDTEDEIKNALETVCRILPSSLEDKCDEYIEAYAEKIIELVLQEFTPDQICKELGLCAASAISEEPKEPIVLTVGDQKCIVCEYIMSYLEDALGQNSTEAEIKEALDEVCGYMPGSFKDQCETFVNQYTDVIIDFLTHQLTPEQVCKQIGLCAQHETNAEQFDMIEHAREIIEQDEQLPESSRPYCTLCEYAIGEMDKLVTDKKNMYQVKAALDRICYELSSPIQKQCLKMVDEYTDEIIQMFVNEYTPQEVCYEIGLCDPPTNEIEVEHIETNVIPRNFEIEEEQTDLQEEPLCVLCEYAMKVLLQESGIMSNRTIDMAEHAVEMLCSYMPETIEDKCIDLVQEYGDQIIEIILKEEFDPEQICAILTLCNVSATSTWDASPVGGNRCHFGPALWCQSRVHAKACGTTRYCEETGWN